MGGAAAAGPRRTALRERLHEPGIQSYGLLLSVIGMIVFGVGLTYGLAALGQQLLGVVIYGVFLLAVSLIDFYRKEFNL